MQEIFKLNIGERFISKDGDIYVRVPGGWVVSLYGADNRIFVSYSEDLKVIEEKISLEKSVKENVSKVTRFNMYDSFWNEDGVEYIILPLGDDYFRIILASTDNSKVYEGHLGSAHKYAGILFVVRK